MVSSRQVFLPRCLLVAATATVAYGGLLVWLGPSLSPAPTDGVASALVRLCAGVALVAAGWLWLATTLTVLAALRGRGQHAPGVPTPLRRAVLAACGVALTGSLVAVVPADATPGSQHEDRVANASVVAGLPLPDRAAAPVARPVADGSSTVVVAPGDTLWAIAARSLPTGASNAEIGDAWRRIYDLNRADIGPDPDLIHPAQRLEVLP